ncbi:MAG TPA: hypothetical protein H9825_08885, partial [Candidatus Sphingobacterium stercorigallinarum]|nr:hypothetical protein [Candidatus Sphingobacterium stercorigallinarum]
STRVVGVQRVRFSGIMPLPGPGLLETKTATPDPQSYASACFSPLTICRNRRFGTAANSRNNP